jgi:outer membrane lipoprotein-sorting protein
MRRILFVLFSGAALASVGLAGQAADVEAVQKSIQEAWSRHKSMTAHLQMVSHRIQGDAALDGKGEGQVEVLRKGEQYVQRKQAQTEMRRTAPAAEDSTVIPVNMTIILDGQNEYLIREGGGQKFYIKMTTKLASSVVPQDVIALLAQLAELKTLPEQTIDGQKVWVIDGMRHEPDKYTGTARTVLYFLQDSGALRRQEHYDAANVKCETYDYTDFQFDLDLDPQRFVFDPPPGANVIDRTRKRNPTTTQSTQPGEPASQPARRSPVVGRLPPPAKPTDPAPSEPPPESPRY